MNHLKLSELNHLIGEALYGRLGGLSWWVVADVTNHTFRDQKSYHNFELVEKDTTSNRLVAKIGAKAWGNGSMRIDEFERVTGQRFTNNIQVLVNVSVEYHPVYGLQLNLNDIDPTFTLGVLEQQRQAVLERLVKENPGYIEWSGDRFVTRNNQLRLNAVIQRIAIISSKTSAGGEDFRHTLENNPFGYKFSIDAYDTAVQGEHNADQFLAKIIEVFQSGIPYDAVVITRGGGAQTDFLIFDHYQVGRAVARFPIPIITGIGHQKNETITDLMAHTPTKTPTKAAEFILAHNKNYEDGLLALQRQIVIHAQQQISFNFQWLADAKLRVMHHTRATVDQRRDELQLIRHTLTENARSILFAQHQHLTQGKLRLATASRNVLNHGTTNIARVSERMGKSSSQLLRTRRADLAHLDSLLRILSPDNIMKRGFAMVQVGDKIVTRAADIEVGNGLGIIFADGKVTAHVDSKTTSDGQKLDV